MDNNCGSGRQSISKAAVFLCLHVGLIINLKPCHSHEPEIFSLPAYDDLLTVPVTIADREHLFVLDTGATYNFVDTQLKNLLGEFIQTHDVRGARGGYVSGASYQAPPLHIGKIPLQRNSLVVSLDMSLIRSAMGRDIRGILGMPFFTTHVVQVDFGQRKLRIFPDSPKRNDKWGTPIKTTSTESNLPVISASIGNYASEPCIVDLGYNGTASLRAGVYDYLVQTNQIVPRTATHSATISGVGSTPEGVLSKLSLANFHHEQLFVTKSPSKLSRLGIKYFRRYTMTIDLGHKQIYLTKGARYAELDEDFSLGVAILRKHDKTMIHAIAPDSRAEKSGFQKNDELLQVAGERIAKQPIAEIGWIIETAMREQKTIKAKICRDGDVRKLEIVADY